MASERITENIVRNFLQSLSYYDDKNVTVEEQSSERLDVKKLLKYASKTGKGGKGFPEFIISNKYSSDFLIIIECKKDLKDHKSPKLDNPKKYALDGVLHYGKALSKKFNVICIAVSGVKEQNLRISNYIIPKNSNKKVLVNSSKKEIKNIISINDYLTHGTFDEEVARRKHDDLMEFSKQLHNFMRDNAKLTESEKPLLVSGTLIALKNKAFAKSFDAYKPEELQNEWMRVIKDEFRKAKIPDYKEFKMTQPYSSIAVHPNLGKGTKKFPRGILFELIDMLNEKVWPFISIYNDYDVVGQFYGEFLKYTGGDKKSLGIVLTPRHITELFSLLANVQTDSKVLDLCAGTGGFLISAMHQMTKLAEDKKTIEKIKKENLFGVEDQPNMYALAASNMILRGDGKANLLQGDCFNPEIVKKITSFNCDIGMVNPPYSQKDEDLHELEFVDKMLDCLVKNGTGIAIIPMSCAIAPHPKKEEILKKHTLEAVMSMPDQLFYPVGVVSCIMIFKAKVSHTANNKPTWFGYWKNDGFKVVPHRGRIDPENEWLKIREKFLKSYTYQEVKAGFSVKHKVSHEDEWCAEAYMETNYSSLNKELFEKTLKDYSIFKLVNKINND